MSRFDQTEVMALPTAFLVGPVVSAEPSDLPVTRQLRVLGYDVMDTRMVDDLAAVVSTAPPGPVALVDRRYVGHLHALRRAVRDTRSEALAGPGTLTVAGTSRAHLLGVLAGLPTTTRTTAAAGAGQDRPTGGGSTDLETEADAEPLAGASGLVDLAELTDSLAEKLAVRRMDPAPLVAGLADTADERAVLDAHASSVDEESVRLASSVKADDTAFTTFFVRSYSGYVARWLARLGFSPNQVTVLSLAVALGAAGLCATGTRAGYITGALLFHVSFVLDCVDGDLARYTVRFSKLGARLDLTADRVKEFTLFAGLAIGVTQADPSIWWLAAAAMAFQTVRHQMHFAYDEVTAGLDSAPALTSQVQSRLIGGRWKVWLRRAAVLPQGERSALICVLVAFTTPRTVFVVLLVAGLLAATYAFLGRLLRSMRRLHRPWSKSAGQALGSMVDVGPLGWIVHHALPGRSLPAPLTTLIALAVLTFSVAVIPLVGGSWVIVGVLWYALLVGFASQQPLNGWADWVLPPSYRAAEYALPVAAAALLEPRALPAAFCYVAACAFHHYNTVYRLRETGVAPPKWLVIVTGGHDGRMIVVGLLALGGAGVLHVGLTVVASVLAAVFVAESVVAGLLRARADAARTSGPPALARSSSGAGEGAAP